MKMSWQLDRYCEVVWAMRDEYMGHTFFDASASSFFLDLDHDPSSSSSSSSKEASASRHRHIRPKDASSALEGPQPSSPIDVEPAESTSDRRVFANALGPNWLRSLHELASSDSAAEEPAGKRPRPSDKRFPIVMETTAELEALRGSGRGQVGELSDGEWHNVQGASAGRGGNLTSPIAADGGWPCYVRLTNGHVYGCSFVVSATGVWPETSLCQDDEERGVVFRREDDGGLVVDDAMRTTGSENVYAAGDAASVKWPSSKLWFQMRLWSQARVMGSYAAANMVGTLDWLELEGGYNFELFAHSTNFFGFKVVLLGAFNGQGLGEAYEHAIHDALVATEAGVVTLDGDSEPLVPKAPEEAPSHHDPNGVGRRSSDVEVQLRVTPGREYVKIVLHRGRVVGCILIGDTDLEEAMENLIMNELDVSGMDLLNPAIDIDDLFD